MKIGCVSGKRLVSFTVALKTRKGRRIVVFTYCAWWRERDQFLGGRDRAFGVCAESLIQNVYGTYSVRETVQELS